MIVMRRGKEHEVADDHEWQISDGALAQVGEGDTAHGETKECRRAEKRRRQRREAD